MLGTIGKRVLEKAFANTIKAIESRNAPAATVKPKSVQGVPNLQRHDV
jgi:hypothetical protein